MEFLKKIGKRINELLVEEWALQGHKMPSSKFEGEMETRIEKEGDTYILQGLSVYYARFINQGVSSSQIKSPYAPPRIKGLTKYVLSRMGIGGSQGVAIAYAIATKHKQEGMPTKDSYQYSDTGKRTEFIEDTFKKAEREIDEVFEQELSNYVVSILP
jgi:hypothetical protein